MSRLVPWFALAGLLAACRHDGGENLGLGARRAVDLKRLHQPDELVRALGLPGPQIDARLGAHRLEASSALTVSPPGKPAEKLEETYRLDSDGLGALHLVHDNTRGGGLEAVLAGGNLYVRPRYGKFVAHRPEGDEVDRLRALVEGVGAGYLGVLQRWIAVRDDGRAEVDGRAGIRLKLSARAEPLAAPAESPPPGQRWRDQLTVRAIDGDVVLDASSGAPLAVTLEASYAVARAGEAQPMVVSLVYRQKLARAEPVVAPTELAPEPRRPRPLVDRQELLDGLVAHE